jgi:hypothetical protein
MAARGAAAVDVVVLHDGRSSPRPGDDPVGARKSKAQWLETLFATTEFPRITNVNFFPAARAYDWRLNSSPDALEICRSALGS